MITYNLKYRIYSNKQTEFKALAQATKCTGLDERSLTNPLFNGATVNELSL